jgi:rhodanese-related sulfurtransferase
MAKASISILLTIVLFGAACSSDADQAGPSASGGANAVAESASQLLEPAEFARYMEDNPDVPVVNVHIPYEGHIEGTDSFVAFDEIADWDGLPEDRSAPLALYCRSGNMSAQATDTLEALGYTNVVDLKGGMNAWTDAGFELLTEKPPSAD